MQRYIIYLFKYKIERIYFYVLTDLLHPSREGIAVLRYDDRGTAYSTGNFSTATTKDFADDAMAGVKFLKTHKKINPNKIGIIGHSEGGSIAPMLAAKSKDIAFIVMLAGPGLSGSKTLILQRYYINKTMLMDEKTLNSDTLLWKKIYSVIETEKDNKKAGEKIKFLLLESSPDSIKKDKKILFELNKTIYQLTTPWIRFFITYNPQDDLKKVKCPVLALNGEKDLQILPKQNLAAIETALKKAGNKDYTIKEIPELNHLFQHCKTGSPTEYANIEETISPEVLEIMTNWILLR